MIRSLSFTTLAVGLALSSSAFAQSPPVAVPPSPPPPGATQMSSPNLSAGQLPLVTQSSRIRAFNAGPTGEVRSLYLQNGSVVDIPPDVGQQLTGTVRKGARVTVTGASSNMKGQRIIAANRITLNSQNFVSQAPAGSTAAATPPPPPPPPPGPGGPGRRLRGAPPPPPPPPPAGDPGAVTPPPPPPAGAPGTAPPPPPAAAPGTVAPLSPPPANPQTTPPPTLN